MPAAFVPPGCRAVLIGQAVDIEDLGAFAPLEESSAEGTPVLMKLTFSAIPSGETLADLEQACRDAGVEASPGCEYFVYADEAESSVYLVWQKGLAWLPIIIGLVATVVLPPLLGAGIWLILPDSFKSLISNLINLSMMVMMMWLVMSFMKPLLAQDREKPKALKESSG
ncbi:MAG: hypothetical protein JXA46_04300 [Dehalococcoidales bacterium]|nr:hypothetical protein [Dehalococcoidales bacterium]